MVYEIIPDSEISLDHMHCKTICLFASALVTVKIAGDGTLKMSAGNGHSLLLQCISIYRSLRKRGEQMSKWDHQRSYHTFLELLGLPAPHPAKFCGTVRDLFWSSEAIKKKILPLQGFKFDFYNTPEG